MAGKAGFKLDEFIAANADFARGYTFFINVPASKVAGITEQKYLVKTSSLPASTISPAEVNWQGNAYKLGTTQEFAEFTVTYSVDIADNIRLSYLDWMTEIHNPKENTHGDPKEYMQNIQLEHLSHADGSTLMEYELVLAWPSMVGEMALDYASKETATFDVTFTYQYHTIKAGGTGA